MRSFGLIEEPLGDKEHQRSESSLGGSSHSHLDMETSLNMEVAPGMIFCFKFQGEKHIDIQSYSIRLKEKRTTVSPIYVVK